MVDTEEVDVRLDGGGQRRRPSDHAQRGDRAPAGRAGVRAAAQRAADHRRAGARRQRDDAAARRVDQEADRRRAGAAVAVQPRLGDGQPPDGGRQRRGWTSPGADAAEADRGDRQARDDGVAQLVRGVRRSSVNLVQLGAATTSRGINGLHGSSRPTAQPVV